MYPWLRDRPASDGVRLFDKLSFGAQPVEKAPDFLLAQVVARADDPLRHEPKRRGLRHGQTSVPAASSRSIIIRLSSAIPMPAAAASIAIWLRSKSAAPTFLRLEARRA